VSAAVETVDLTKRFGAFVAVDRLTLRIETGEVFGLLGSNGAGKSTAIRMLTGLLAPTSGEARVLGVDVVRDPETVKRSLGYMSQRFSLYDDLTVEENLRFFGGVYGLHGARLAARIEEASSFADLSGEDGRLARELPGGWKQKLALACALLHRPTMLFLDEPTGGVDPLSRRRFWERIDTLAESGVTVLVTTHYLDEAEHCGRIAMMHAGRTIATGSVSELKSIFAGRAILEVVCPRYLAALERLERESWVREATLFGTRIHLVVDDPVQGVAAARTLLEEAGNVPAEIERIVPSLEDVFIHTVETAETVGRAEAAP
jgi:ABC-2 type transport system ATP-binding protein